MSRAVLRLHVAGADTLVTSPMCARCPDGPVGCCAAPPAIAWSDVARIVGHGGAAWLLGELGGGRLRPSPNGLAIERVDPRGALPSRCVYLAPTGCTLAPEHRSSTCNYYLCGSALDEARDCGDNAVEPARRAQSLAERLGAIDMQLADAVRERWPAGPTWNDAFLRWLEETSREPLARLRSRS